MKGSTVLLVGGLLVGGYILWQVIGKDMWRDHAVNWASGIADSYNNNPQFRSGLQKAVAPITQKANYTYY